MLSLKGTLRGSGIWTNKFLAITVVEHKRCENSSRSYGRNVTAERYYIPVDTGEVWWNNRGLTLAGTIQADKKPRREV